MLTLEKDVFMTNLLNLASLNYTWAYWHNEISYKVVYISELRFCQVIGTFMSHVMFTVGKDSTAKV